MIHRALAILTALILLSATTTGARGDSPTSDTQQEPKSADQLAWEAQVAPKYKTWPALEYLKEEPGLPRALLIGDSISVGYTTRVRRNLAGKVNVHRVPINGGSTLVGLEHMAQWLGWKEHWDVIHFNFGLHDLARTRDDRPDATGEVRVAVDEYARNLEKLLGQLEQTGARLIWATTTPVPEGAAGRRAGDELIYNAAAEKVMREHGVQINDLHAFILPLLAVAQEAPDVHFLDPGNDLLAGKVAAEILGALDADTKAQTTP